MTSSNDLYLDNCQFHKSVQQRKLYISIFITILISTKFKLPLYFLTPSVSPFHTHKPSFLSKGLAASVLMSFDERKYVLAVLHPRPHTHAISAQTWPSKISMMECYKVIAIGVKSPYFEGHSHLWYWIPRTLYHFGFFSLYSLFLIKRSSGGSLRGKWGQSG